MSELSRISISLETVLLEAFDRSNEGKGYATRSEAIRDLIREHLISQEVVEESPDAEVMAIVTLVFDHHERELAARLIDKQHHHHDLVVSTLHVHLGDRHCLEVTILRGKVRDIRHLGEEMLALRGVLHGKLMLTSGEKGFNKLH
jgi:CopG family nickel-responsive transcriptional regulator